MLWGLTLHPGQPCTTELKEVIHLSLATLESRAGLGKDQSYSQVIIATESSEQLLCTLVNGVVFQQCLDLKLMPQEKVTFTVQGSNTVFMTGYSGRVPERQQDVSERMEETREQGSVSMPRIGDYEGVPSETEEESMVYQEGVMEVGVASEGEPQQSCTALMTETPNLSAESEFPIEGNIEEEGFDEVDVSADEHLGVKPELQGFEHKHEDDHVEELHKNDEGNQTSSGPDGQEAPAVSSDVTSTTALTQQLVESLHNSQVKRNPLYSGRRYFHGKRIPRHRLVGKRLGYVDIVSRKRMKYGGNPRSTYTDESTTSHLFKHASPEGSSTTPPPECLSQPASPSLPEELEVESRPLSAPSFTNQDCHDISQSIGASSFPISSPAIPTTEETPTQLNHPESVSTMATSSQPWSSDDPEVQPAISQSSTVPPPMNQDISAASGLYPLPSSFPTMSSARSMYHRLRHPLHHGSFTPVVTVLPLALKGIPVEAAIFVNQLEHRIRALESKTKVPPVEKGKSPLCTEENGSVTIGQKRGPTVKVDVERYKSVWENSTCGKDLVVKLLPLVFSDEVLGSSNFHGGQVFSGQGWVRKNQLSDHPSFVAIVEQARIEFPGCFNSVEQYRELQDAVNAKCSMAGTAD